jgi:hypothetical protein
MPLVLTAALTKKPYQPGFFIVHSFKQDNSNNITISSYLTEIYVFFILKQHVICTTVEN